MNHAEFNAAVEEHLTGMWGEKAYPQKSLGRLFVVVSHIRASDFVAALDKLALETMRAPSLAQIRGACLPAIQRARDEYLRAELKKIDGCRYCGLSGLIQALRRANPIQEFAFRCTYCRAAELRRIRAIPDWSEHFRRDFIPTSLRKESYEAARALQKSAREGGGSLMTDPDPEFEQFASELLKRAQAGGALE